MIRLETSQDSIIMGEAVKYEVINLQGFDMFLIHHNEPVKLI